MRVRLLRVYIERRPLSPKEASNLLHVPLGDISYHVRVLVNFKFLVLHRTEQVRGAKKHYYLPNDKVVNSSIVRQFLATSTE